jgi:prepilin-type N-terminal cleavage/methylation domain-containing protein
MRKNKRGFTLIEVLIVLGIIAILAAIVLVALNPGRQFAEARNTQRLSNVTTILNGVSQRITENHGTFAGSAFDGVATTTCPSLVASTDYNIGSATGAGNIDLSCLTPTYIPGGLPVDPSATGAHWVSPSDYDTKYHIKVDVYGRYTVSAPTAELSEAIVATR